MVMNYIKNKNKTIKIKLAFWQLVNPYRHLRKCFLY